MAQQATLFVDQGATYRAVLTLTSNGAPYSLTGCSARMQVRQNYGAPNVITELNTTNGQLALGGAAGTITIAWPASATAALPVAAGGGTSAKTTTFVYDLTIVDSSGNVTRALQGTIVVSPAVTI